MRATRRLPVDVLTHMGWTRSTAIPTGLYLLISAAALGQLTLSLDLAPALRLIAALVLIGTLPGAALVRQLFREPTLLHYLVFGTSLGLSLWSVGGMLSHLTGLVPVRWIPVVLALLVWLVPRRPATGGSSTRRVMPVHGILGATLGLIAMLPAVRVALASQPTQWEGWFRFYGDIPFQVAVTAEVAAHAPQEAPWVADTALSYTWLFHSSMGVWASAAGTTAADVVLQAWPVLFVILVPALLALVAWEITRNRHVALASPLLFVLGHGLVVMDGPLAQVPLFQISPTRDFANVFIVIAVLSLVRLLSRPSFRATSLWWYLALALATFAAAGSKGSAMPILLGGVLAALFILLVARRFRRTDLLAAAVFGASALTSFFLVLPFRGPNDAVSWGPLTFIPPEDPERLASSVSIVVLLLISVVGIWVAIGRSRRRIWTVASLLAGVTLAGLLGQTLLAHSGYSQLYFWQNAQPILAIALAWAGAILIRVHGRRLVFAIAAMLLLANVLWMITHRIWTVGLAIALVASVAALFLIRTERDGAARRRGWGGSLWAALPIAALLIQSAQLVSIPIGTSGGAPADETDVGAIESTQRDAFDYIRTNSASDDVIVTNKHCLNGSLADDDCNGQWFALAAWSERRVLVDGWVYTQNGPDRDWVEDRLELSDDFIESPTRSEFEQLAGAGVGWAYVDTREPHSDDLAEFGELVYESDWAQVYRLG